MAEIVKNPSLFHGMGCALFIIGKIHSLIKHILEAIMELQESLENEMIILAALSDTENKSNADAATSILKQQLAKIPLKVALGMRL